MKWLLGVQDGRSRFREFARSGPHSPVQNTEWLEPQRTAATYSSRMLRRADGPPQPGKGSQAMNSIIYLVGLVVVVAIILSFLGVL